MKRLYGEISYFLRQKFFIPAGNEPSGCVSIHLANTARVKYPAACCVARLIPRQLAAGYLIAVVAIIAICSYGFAITHQSMGADDTIIGLYLDEGLTVVMGRWTKIAASGNFE